MTKPQLKVAFYGFWDTDEIIFEHYFKNSHRFLWKKWDVVNVADPHQADVIFCSVFSQNWQMPPLTGKPKIMLVHENVRPSHAWFDSFDYIISFTPNLTHLPRHFRIPYWAYRFYEHDIKLSDLQNRSNIKSGQDSSEKFYTSRRFCNFVYSNPFFFRREFAHKLSLYRQVDFGGRVDTNIGDGERSEITPSLFGSAGLVQKKKWLSKYRFTIAFENSSSEGYTTEKILDSFVAGSVPLYWGNLRIKQDGFNSAAFLNYFEYPGDENFVARIKQIDQSENDYLEMLSQPVFTTVPDYLHEDYMIKFYDDMFNKRIGYS